MSFHVHGNTQIKNCNICYIPRILIRAQNTFNGLIRFLRCDVNLKYVVECVQTVEAELTKHNNWIPTIYTW